MLMIQIIEMRWYKKDRNPEGSLIRKKYLCPVELKQPVLLPDNSESVYINEICYYQHGEEVKEILPSSNNGIVSLKDLELNCIDIEKTEDGTYKISWYDDKDGRVQRRGGNKDFGKKGKKLKNFPNLLNETAFVLKDGESGMIRWNNRYTSYHGQHYLQCQVYFVNTDTLNKDTFIREYDHEYQQMADLF